MVKEKPTVLSDEKITEILDRHAKEEGDTNWKEVLVKAQRDADVEWYDNHWSKGELEMIKHGTAVTRFMQDIAVEQARQETAREIFEHMEMVSDTHFGSYYGVKIEKSIWQSLKSKFTGG